MSLRDDYQADALSRDVPVLCPACGEPADSNVFPCDTCAVEQLLGSALASLAEDEPDQAAIRTAVSRRTVPE